MSTATEFSAAVSSVNATPFDSAGGLPSSTATWIRRASAACRAAARGDLEPRLLHIDVDGDLGELLHSINHLLDMTDAFVREATAALDHAGKDQFFRKVLPSGMLGAFGLAAGKINAAMDMMAERTQTLRAVEAEQKLLNDNQFKELENARLREEALAGEFETAQQVINRLVQASGEIKNISRMISDVAGQTKFLALNASIETARVGSAGAGFAVVAAEVKELAGQTTDAARKIDDKLVSVHACSNDASMAIQRIQQTLQRK